MASGKLLRASSRRDKEVLHDLVDKDILHDLVDKEILHDLVESSTDHFRHPRTGQRAVSCTQVDESADSKRVAILAGLNPRAEAGAMGGPRQRRAAHFSCRHQARGANLSWYWRLRSKGPLLSCLCCSSCLSSSEVAWPLEAARELRKGCRPPSRPAAARNSWLDDVRVALCTRCEGRPTAAWSSTSSGSMLMDRDCGAQGPALRV